MQTPVGIEDEAGDRALELMKWRDENFRVDVRLFQTDPPLIRRLSQDDVDAA